MTSVEKVLCASSAKVIAMETNKNWRVRRSLTVAIWFLSLASAEPSPAIRGADNSDVLKELGVDIQNDGKHEKESVWSTIAIVNLA